MIANKFALIFVAFLRQDFPNLWQDAFAQLFGLLQSPNADEVYQLKIRRFIVKVMKTFNSELIERGEAKVSHDLLIATQVKDGIRQLAITSILDMLLDTVLSKMALFSKEEVQDVLYILAQLIDWNELPQFEGLVSHCMQALQSNDPAFGQEYKNGAFNCIQAVVCKGMDHNEKIGVIG